jgi:hypothetical protein
LTTSLRVVALRGLANAERPSGAWKTTVLRRLRELKLRPRILIVCPTRRRIGATRVIFGFLAVERLAAGAAAGTASGTRAARARQIEVVVRRRMSFSLSTVLVAT